MKLTVINNSSRRAPRAFLAAWIGAIDRLAAGKIPARKFRGRELVIAFFDEKPARALNRQYRGKDYATDVLSFSGDEAGALGELAICPQVLLRQAREHGLSYREELGYMVLHGFLHLLGFDHERSAREARRMFALQDELFEKLLKQL